MVPSKKRTWSKRRWNEVSRGWRQWTVEFRPLCFCKIFRTNRNLVSFTRRRLYWWNKRIFNPFHDTCVLLFLSFESCLRRYYTKRLESFEKQQPIETSHSVVESVGCYQNISCAIFKVILITGKHCNLLTLIYVNFVAALYTVVKIICRFYCFSFIRYFTQDIFSE